MFHHNSTGSFLREIRPIAVTLERNKINSITKSYDLIRILISSQ